MKKLIIGIVVLAIIAICVITFTRTRKDAGMQVPETISVVYITEDGSSLPAVFNNKAGTVTITTPKTGIVTLQQTVSASGARYANEDESIVVWDKGGDVMIEQDGEIVYQGSADESQTVRSKVMVNPAPVAVPEITDDASNVTSKEPATPAPANSENTGIVSGDAARKLTANAWVWEETQMNDDSVTKPNKPGDFVLTFTTAGRVQGDTDCNNFNGSYVLGQDNQISFGPIASTLMYCEGAKENIFTKQFQDVSSVYFAENGNLVLLIKYDSGSMIFKKR